MNRKGKLNSTEKGQVALGICQELAYKLGAANRKGLSLTTLLATLGYSPIEAQELTAALVALGLDGQ